MKYGLQIAEKGVEKACENPAVKAGLNCYLGKLTNENVAKAHGYEYTDPADLF